MSTRPPVVAGSVHRVAVIGAGPIGLAVADAVRRRSDLVLAAVVDIDPMRIGFDVGELRGEVPWGIEVRQDLLGVDARCALVCTSSSIEAALPVILDCIARRMHVVATCEELAWPFDEQAALAARVDAQARAAGVVVIGTGVNPGFLMDTLPLVATGIAGGVRSLRVERVQDAGVRRQPFQDKIGMGMSAMDFAIASSTSSGFGHRGLRNSAQMIARALGLPGPLHLEESLRPLVAEQTLVAHGRFVPAGHVRGIEQTAQVRHNGRVVVDLYFRAALAEEEPRDRVVIDADPTLVLSLQGTHGDVATAAIIVNTALRAPGAMPGLRTMLDLPLPTARLVDA